MMFSINQSKMVVKKSQVEDCCAYGPKPQEKESERIDENPHYSVKKKKKRLEAKNSARTALMKSQKNWDPEVKEKIKKMKISCELSRPVSEAVKDWDKRKKARDESKAADIKSKLVTYKRVKKTGDKLNELRKRAKMDRKQQVINETNQMGVELAEEFYKSYVRDVKSETYVPAGSSDYMDYIRHKMKHLLCPDIEYGLEYSLPYKHHKSFTRLGLEEDVYDNAYTRRIFDVMCPDESRLAKTFDDMSTRSGDRIPNTIEGRNQYVEEHNLTAKEYQELEARSNWLQAETGPVLPCAMCDGIRGRKGITNDLISRLQFGPGGIHQPRFRLMCGRCNYVPTIEEIQEELTSEDFEENDEGMVHLLRQVWELRTFIDVTNALFDKSHPANDCDKPACCHGITTSLTCNSYICILHQCFQKLGDQPWWYKWKGRSAVEYVKPSMSSIWWSVGRDDKHECGGYNKCTKSIKRDFRTYVEKFDFATRLAEALSTYKRLKWARDRRRALYKELSLRRHKVWCKEIGKFVYVNMTGGGSRGYGKKARQMYRRIGIEYYDPKLHSLEPFTPKMVPKIKAVDVQYDEFGPDAVQEVVEECKMFVEFGGGPIYEAQTGILGKDFSNVLREAGPMMQNISDCATMARQSISEVNNVAAQAKSAMDSALPDVKKTLSGVNSVLTSLNNMLPKFEKFTTYLDECFTRVSGPIKSLNEVVDFKVFFGMLATGLITSIVSGTGGFTTLVATLCSYLFMKGLAQFAVDKVNDFWHKFKEIVEKVRFKSPQKVHMSVISGEITYEAESIKDNVKEWISMDEEKTINGISMGVGGILFILTNVLESPHNTPEKIANYVATNIKSYFMNKMSHRDRTSLTKDIGVKIYDALIFVVTGQSMSVRKMDKLYPNVNLAITDLEQFNLNEDRMAAISDPVRASGLVRSYEYLVMMKPKMFENKDVVLHKRVSELLHAAEVFYRKAKHHLAGYTTARPEPVMVNFHGPPDQGKSSLVKNFVERVHNKLSNDARWRELEVARCKMCRVEEGIFVKNIDCKALHLDAESNGDSLVYTKNIAEEWWSDYNNQFATLLDELFADIDSPSKPELSITMIQRMVNCAPYPLPMAEAHEKGTKYFNSPLIVGTSNVEFPTIKSKIPQHVPAIRRRITFNVSTELKEGYYREQDCPVDETGARRDQIVRRYCPIKSCATWSNECLSVAKRMMARKGMKMPDDWTLADVKEKAGIEFAAPKFYNNAHKLCIDKYGCMGSDRGTERVSVNALDRLVDQVVEEMILRQSSKSSSYIPKAADCSRLDRKISEDEYNKMVQEIEDEADVVAETIDYRDYDPRPTMAAIKIMGPKQFFAGTFSRVDTARLEFSEFVSRGKNAIVRLISKGSNTKAGEFVAHLFRQTRGATKCLADYLLSYWDVAFCALCVVGGGLACAKVFSANRCRIADALKRGDDVRKIYGLPYCTSLVPARDCKLCSALSSKKTRMVEMYRPSVSRGYTLKLRPKAAHIRAWLGDILETAEVLGIRVSTKMYKQVLDVDDSVCATMSSECSVGYHDHCRTHTMGAPCVADKRELKEEDTLYRCESKYDRGTFYDRIREIIGRKVMTLPGTAYVGPNNDLEKQVDYDVRDVPKYIKGFCHDLKEELASFLRNHTDVDYRDVPLSRVDEIAAKHDMLYNENKDPQYRHLSDKVMFHEVLHAAVEDVEDFLNKGATLLGLGVKITADKLGGVKDIPCKKYTSSVVEHGSERQGKFCEKVGKNIIRMKRIETNSWYTALMVEKQGAMMVGHEAQFFEVGQKIEVSKLGSSTSEIVTWQIEKIVDKSNSDLAMVWFSSKTPPCKSIVKNFRSRETPLDEMFAKTRNTGSAYVARVVHDNIKLENGTRQVFGVRFSDITPGSLRSAHEKYTNGDKVIDNSNLIGYQGVSGLGMCGSCLIFDTKDSIFIGGLHVAGAKGNPGTLGFASSITREDIAEFLERCDDGKACSVELVGETIWKTPLMVGPFENVHCVLGHTGVGKQRRTTKIITSGLQENGNGPFGPVKKGPAVLEHPEIDILEVQMKKLCTDTAVVEKNVVDEIVDDMAASLMKGTYKSSRKILTYAEAITGENTNLGPIERTTSPGFPWSKKCKDKTLWLGKGEDYNTNDPEMRAAVEELIITAKQNKRLLQRGIFTASLKDEKRSHAKIASLSTRMFAAGPVDLNIAHKMYFGSFVEAMMAQRIDNGIGLGLNPFSMDWKILANNLRKKGGNNIMALDYQSWDAKTMRQAMLAACEAINKWYDDGEENKQVRRVLFEYIASSVWVLNGYFVQMDHSMPSGCYLTTIVNCLLNLFNWRYAYMMLREKHIGKRSLTGFSEMCME